MSGLQDTFLLQRACHRKFPKAPTPFGSAGRQQHGHQPLRSKDSIASLINFVRNPQEVVGVALEGIRNGSTGKERVRRQSIESKKQLLYLKLRNATEYGNWRAAATELDEIEENNIWKSIVESPDYDSALVAARLKQLDDARHSCEVGRMLFLIRTQLTRGLGNMGNLKLYKHTHLGTKDLIEAYITSALSTLEALLKFSAGLSVEESKHILQQVLAARQAFGRSALLLSGGATFGMSHIGVLKALWEARLLPRIISGASAGSIVCAVVCTRTDEEIPGCLPAFCYGDLAVFDEDGKDEGVMQKVARFLKYGALFDISHLTRVMKDMLGDLTFQEAYNRTRRILNICVSSASVYELPRLLNYVTAPNVLIWSAVAASCSVPFVYTAASLLAKDPKTGQAVPWNPSPQRWIDGSVDNDLPMTRLAEMFNVNHFIVSQVNPHVVPFLEKEEESIAEEAQNSTQDMSSGSTWVKTLADLAKGEALHRFHVLAEIGIFPNTLSKAISVLSQKYSGDITIMPEISYADFPRMLRNPTSEFMERAMLSGERATWPKMTRIRNHCAIELALDDAVQKLRARVVFSPNHEASRINSHSRTTSLNPKEANLGRIWKRRRRLAGENELKVSSVQNTYTLPTRIVSETRHQTYDSLNTPRLRSDDEDLASPPPPMPMSIDDGVPSTAPAHITYAHYDLASGAEATSNITTSTENSDDEFSFPSSSAESPASPSSPFLGTIDRQLFPSASQPTTPFGHHATSIVSSPFDTPRTSYIMPPTAETQASMLTRRLSLSMTKSPLPVIQGMEDKRLPWHGATQRSTPVQPPGSASVWKGQKSRTDGLQIEIPGTREMLSRNERLG